MAFDCILADRYRSEVNYGRTRNQNDSHRASPGKIAIEYLHFYWLSGLLIILQVRERLTPRCVLFEFLSISVIVLLLTWWRLEIRKVLLDLPALPGWLQKSAQHSGGLKGYLFTALGGLYLVFIFSRQFFIRQLSNFEGGKSWSC